MGIGRDSKHKRRLTGGRMPVHQKKRQYESGRPAANTKLGPKRVRFVRTRGGNAKYRALLHDHGNFTWASEGFTGKTTIINCMYNATNNELVRTKTLVKNSVILIDATPFVNYVNRHYNGKHFNQTFLF
jgi:small subunit ribosomal protein S8e